MLLHQTDRLCSLIKVQLCSQKYLFISIIQNGMTHVKRRQLWVYCQRLSVFALSVPKKPELSSILQRCHNLEHLQSFHDLSSLFVMQLSRGTVTCHSFLPFGPFLTLPYFLHAWSSLFMTDRYIYTGSVFGSQMAVHANSWKIISSRYL
jgi:hypothetical protein